MKVLNSYIVIFLASLGLFSVKAQDALHSGSKILLSGEISCIDPMNGNMSSVMVFNISQGYGTISNPDGSFAIKMAREDTIMFSTAEHKEYYYVIEPKQDFVNHSIEVTMITDAIWLDAVTIMGQQSLEEFKREILSLDLPQGDNSLALPVINKYARQLATGDGQTNLVGPLTYLHNKFDRYYKMRKKVEESKPMYK